MDATSALVLVVLPFLLLGCAVAAVLAWRRDGGVLRRLGGGRPGVLPKLLGIVALVGVWLLLTVVSLWCAFLLAFIAVHLLLFWVGPVGAWVGLIAAGALLVYIPFAWGRVILSSAMQW